MSENETKAQGSVGLAFESVQYSLAPGGSLAIPGQIQNWGAKDDFFEISVAGIPAAWVMITPPVQFLAPGQQAFVTLQVTVPPPPQGQSGRYKVTVRAVGQMHSENRVETPFDLLVAAQRAEGRINLLLESTRYVVAPGDSVDIPYVVINQGLVPDHLDLKIDGIPAGWVTAQAQQISLQPGEQKRARLSIRPPRTSQSRAGRIPFRLRLVSRESPGDSVEAACALMVGAFTEFEAELRPQAVDAGDPVTILVRNQGNSNEVFTVQWEDASNSLTFEVAASSTGAAHQSAARRSDDGLIYPVEKVFVPAQSYGLKVPAGETAAVEFRAGLRQSRLYGDYLTYPYVAHISVANGEDEEMLSGEVSARGLLPAWALTAGLGLVVFTLCLVLFMLLWWRLGPQVRAMLPSPPPATNTPDALQRTLGAFQTQAAAWTQEAVLAGTLGVVQTGVAGPTQTVAALQTQVASLTQSVINTQIAGLTQAVISTQAAAQTASANQTQAVIDGQRDSDGDGLTDSQEQNQFGTDPRNPDTDSDTLNDGQEVNVYRTDPRNPDTDRDGLADGEELRRGADPLKPDTDSDILLDGDEVRRGTDPTNADTDGEGLRDGDEVQRNTDPRNPDSDGDYLNDANEVRIGTDPLRPDTDNDRLIDGRESQPCPNPLDPDTDRDGIIDGIDLDPCDNRNPSLTATYRPGASPTWVPPGVTPSLWPTVPPYWPTTVTPPPPPSLTPVPPLPPGPAPSLPTTEGKIAFMSARTGQPAVFVEVLANQQTSQVSNPQMTAAQPAWSPDGSRLLFVSNRDGNNEIYIMKADGTNVINLTSNPANDQFPAWSPDGQNIVFTTDRDGNQEIYSMRPDGTELNNLSKNPAPDYQPTWFSKKNLFITTGNWIAFTSLRDGNQEIYVMGPDGSSQTNLTKNPANDFAPAGEPGGSRIAFTSDRDGNQEIYTMTAKGENIARLTNTPAAEQYSTWSPSQGWLAFASMRDGNWEIYIMKSDGSSQTNMTVNPAEDTYPSWR